MTTIQVPDELAKEIDLLAGAELSFAYAVAVLWKEVRRARQLKALHSSAGSWKAEDHPELAEGGARTSSRSDPPLASNLKCHYLCGVQFDRNQLQKPSGKGVRHQDARLIVHTTGLPGTCFALLAASIGPC